MEKRSPLQIVQSVVFALVLREVQTRFGARRMGAFWTLFEPIAHIGVMVFIFSVIRNRHVPGMDYPVYFLTGMVPFFLMRNIALNIMESVNANKALFVYPNIKPLDTFLARTLIELSISACVYVILLLGMGLWLDLDIAMHQPLQWLAALAIGVVFSFGLGIILCVIVEVAPNTKTFIRLIFMPLYFISGVIFPIWSIPAQYMPWLLWNPYLHIVDNLRSSTFAYYPNTQGVNFSYPAECALIVLFLGLGLYRLRRQQLLAT